jgi:3D (Asp-Asp-Asp) domain-containing protein/peptidoglycan hydrolase CwlO-like protein
VLGQAHTPRRRLWPLVAVALAVLVAPAVSGAIPSHSESSLRAHDAAIEAKSRSAVLSLYSLDQHLASAHAQLATLQDRSVSLREQRETLELELRVAHRSTGLAQRRLAQRLRELYEQGDVGPIEVLFGAQNLDEAITNLDDLSRMSSQSRLLVSELNSAKGRLSAASHRLATREAALAAATRDAEATATQLAHERTLRTAYIASLQAQRRLTQQQLAAAAARAHAAVVATPVPTVATAPSIPEIAPAPGHTITVSATGYSLGGHTSTGLPVGWGVAAVDPSVVPLGTHMTVPGYGQAIAADTGGAVTGATIDLWFPTVAQANAWGRRTVTIVLH